MSARIDNLFKAGFDLKGAATGPAHSDTASEGIQSKDIQAGTALGVAIIDPKGSRTVISL